MDADHPRSTPDHVNGPGSASHGPNVGQPANQTADGTSAQINDSELARAARASQRARQNQRNREIATVLHLSVRVPSYEKWRYVGNWRGWRRLDGVGFHRRKVWEDSWLRSSTVGSEHGEMAP